MIRSFARLLPIAMLVVSSAAHAEKNVEETRKNIRVLQGMPESQIFMAMNSMSQALGVHCDYCHVKHDKTWIWESDEKQPKLVAREMMKMTRAIQPAVTCYACHRGTLSVPRLTPLPPHDPTLDPPRAAIALPPASEILKRYLDAVGAANERFKSTAVDLTVQRSENRTWHAEISIASSGDVDLVATTPQGITRQSTTSLPPEEAAALRRAAAFYDAVRVSEPVAELKVVGAERIGDHDTWAVAVRNKTYYFDARTALLVRERAVNETLLAPLQEQVDFDDYRLIDGVMSPFFVRTSNTAPYDTATRIVQSIKHEK
jgi:hypothetical protein